MEQSHQKTIRITNGTFRRSTSTSSTPYNNNMNTLRSDVQQSRAGFSEERQARPDVGMDLSQQMS
eukprot:12889835-Prorocentrum_lima.AAC.1